MRTCIHLTVLSLIVAGVTVASMQPTGGLTSGAVWAQQGFQKGKAGQKEDMEVFHYLLDHRKEITRKVTRLDDGVETVTESDNKEVAAKIQEHVEAMHRRIKEGRPIHRRDPLFDEIFRHAARIKMEIEKTPKGVRVRETSADAYVARLIQAHADVVSLFIKNGHEEVRKDHALPPRPEGK